MPIIPTSETRRPLNQVSYHLVNEEATVTFGQMLSEKIQPGMMVYLSGDLGAGKTTLVRAILRAWGVTGPIKSPSYSLVEVYVVSGISFYHLDFYRFTSENEWEALGFRDQITDNAVSLIEWPEMAGASLPLPDIWIHLKGTEEQRDITLSAYTELGNQQLKRIDYDTKLD